MARRKPNPNMGASQDLRSIVDRIVALDIEAKQSAKEYSDAVDDLYDEADAKGYDKKALKIAVRRRHESPEQRQKRLETETLAEIYSAAIGDLSGKPLDDLTRRRIDEQMREQERQRNGDPVEEDQPQTEMPSEAVEPAAPPETADEAKEKGREARRANMRIVDNPYHSTSPLRSAWDEGWCEADGSDGMEVPAAWKRAKPPEEEKPGGEGDDKKPDGSPPPANGGGGDEPRPQA